MKAVHDRIEGPFTIREDIALYGVIAGAAILGTGARLVLHGTIAGDLTVEAGAHAILHGTVAGRVYNDGGRVELFGMADAIVDRAASAVTVIDAAACLPGRRRAI